MYTCEDEVAHASPVPADAGATKTVPDLHDEIDFFYLTVPYTADIEQTREAC